MGFYLNYYDVFGSFVKIILGVEGGVGCVCSFLFIKSVLIMCIIVYKQWSIILTSPAEPGSECVPEEVHQRGSQM